MDKNNLLLFKDIVNINYSMITDLSHIKTRQKDKKKKTYLSVRIVYHYVHVTISFFEQLLMTILRSYYNQSSRLLCPTQVFLRVFKDV